ncbi:hypothetical protein DPMN_151482 [Dreissena polymorpha]|uniref:Uncharacterized protein n=1 Tax=Dreissena polymorpha TaxID=45954 RepID=A0A9D4FGJ7_DREPO|nr:hypothetical protein DPMN_151482 [Dreissena polymorpha]
MVMNVVSVMMVVAQAAVVVVYVMRDIMVVVEEVVYVGVAAMVIEAASVAMIRLMEASAVAEAAVIVFEDLHD